MRYLIVDTEKLKKHYPQYQNSKIVKDAKQYGVVLTEEETAHIFKDIFEAGFVAKTPLDFDEYKIGNI